MRYLIVVLLCFNSVLWSKDGLCGSVIDARPRLILNAELIADIKSGLDTYRKEDYQAILNYAESRLINTTPSELAKVGYQPSVMIPLFAAAYFSEQEKYVSYIEKAILAFSRIPAQNDTDLEQRFRLMMLAIGYDWFYDNFSKEQKREIVRSIQSYIEVLKPYLYAPVYTGGHSRFASTAILYGLVSAWELLEVNARETLLSVLAKQWRSGYNPLQEYIAKDGGYHMGWQYSAQLSIWPYLGWEATNVTVLNKLPTFLRGRSSWYLYGLRGDHTFPRLGDINDARLGESWNQILAFAAARYRDPYAEWFYVNYLENSWDPYRVWRLLYRDPNLLPTSPAGNLLFDKSFNNSGVVIFRDAWDDSSTQVVFKSAPFDSVTHHHRDQNHIEISKYGSLLIDSGVYDGYGSEHWLNYYSRSIAHNTLVMDKSNSDFTVLYKNVVNDGGQTFPDPYIEPKGEQPSSIQEIRSDKYRLDGISKFGSGDACGFALGNAARAYRSPNLSKFERYLVFVRAINSKLPALLVLVDRIYKRSGVGARILFHANNKPSKNEYKWIIENAGGGFLKIEVPIGMFSEMKLEGGVGREWKVNEINYPPKEAALKSAKANALDPGSWRLELPVDAIKERSISVTVMTIANKHVEKTLRQSDAIELPWGVAVFANGDAIIIPKKSGAMPSSINLPEFEYGSVNRVLIAENTSKYSRMKSINIGPAKKKYNGVLLYCDDESKTMSRLN